jgi:thiamine-phosphate pyrophosphorylase
MKLVVMSSPQDSENEIQEVIRMFDAGLTHFHIRKPRKSKKQLSAYISSIPSEYHSRLIIHSYHALADRYKLGGIHLSRRHRKRGWWYKFKLRLKRSIQRDLIVTRTFHKLTDITNDKRSYSYAFLSPVFDSITHHTLSGGFSKRALLIMIPQARQPIYAMGGVSYDKFEAVRELGFEGVVLLGSIWKNDEGLLPHEVFRQAKERLRAVRDQI